MMQKTFALVAAREVAFGCKGESQPKRKGGGENKTEYRNETLIGFSASLCLFALYVIHFIFRRGSAELERIARLLEMIFLII